MALLLLLLGAGLLLAGIAALSVAAALICAGVLVMAMGGGLAAAQDRAAQSRPQPEMPEVPVE
jgi:hypothetical protein